MATYPTEIYVRSIDDNRNPNGYVHAKYLTDGLGNYIFNPGIQRFNIFVKDANGQFVSYLTEAQQKGTAIPYIVPFDYNPKVTVAKFDTFLKLGAGNILEFLISSFSGGGADDLQKSYNGVTDTFYVPAFKAAASYNFGLGCAASGLSMGDCLNAGGKYNEYVSAMAILQLDFSINTTGDYGNNPANVPNITLGWRAFSHSSYDQTGYNLFGHDAIGNLDPAIVTAGGRTSVIPLNDGSGGTQTITIDTKGAVNSLIKIPNSTSYAFTLDTTGHITSTTVSNTDGSKAYYSFDTKSGAWAEWTVSATGKLLELKSSKDDPNFIDPNVDNTSSSSSLIDITTHSDSSLNPVTDVVEGEEEIVTNVNNGTALSSANYTVKFTAGGELDSHSFYESTIAGFATDGIRPGNMNLLPAINDYLSPANILGHDIPVTNFNGSSVSISDTWISTNLAAGQQNFQTYVDPLILDLNGDGVKLTNFAEHIVLFDIDHDATASREQTGWVKANTTVGKTWNMDGILVCDLDKDGKIDGIHETLSQYYNGSIGGGDGSDGIKNYRDGFDALKRGFDGDSVKLNSNGNAIFNAADAGWKTVRVWIDANADGQTDTGELKTLTELGITKINLMSTSQSGLVNGGNEVRATGSFTQTVNGIAMTYEAQAVDFIANPAGSTFTPNSTGTVVTISTEATNGSDATTAYTLTSTTGGTLNATTLLVQNLYGNIGNDKLIGNAADNWLVGGDGADTLNAGAGNDVLLIDSQDTLVNGGADNDIAQVIGDQGVVLNLAQSNIEAAIGGRGNDFFYGGGPSTVFIRAGAGDDIVIGSAANDVLSGEDGDDLIDGGAGNDLIRGHRGRDQLLGGAGDDILQGGQDDDRLKGGDGNDVLNGGQGDDLLDGGVGADLAEFSGSYADYWITKLSDTSYRIIDTKSGRDGTDTLNNIEKLSFKDVSWVDPNLASPMPVKDILDKDKSGIAFDHNIAHTISKDQLLGNDIDRQNDTLHITDVYDVQGGTAKIDTVTHDVIFTPNANYNSNSHYEKTI